MAETLFWFHPLVWWLGARQLAERERACDESVIGSGAVPADYADAILKVCECSIDSAAVGRAGIAGSVLGRRMEAIMSARVPKSPGLFVKAGLAILAVALLVGPLSVGAIGANGVQASSGRVAGVVTDQTGRFVPGVEITAASASGVTRSAVSDAFGRYVVADLPAGANEIRFALDGFRPERVSVDVKAGAQTAADAQLRVGVVTESISMVLDRDAQAGRRSSNEAESQVLQQMSERPDDVQAHLALAELYYKEERFAESAIAMDRAAALWAARPEAVPAQPAQGGTAGGEIKPPRKVRDVLPVYPEAARAAHVTGMVILEAVIGEDGTVQDARVTRSVPMLDDAALGAVRQWLYAPARLNGVPVAVNVTTNISFRAE
jgi:TonB family protein